MAAKRDRGAAKAAPRWETPFHSAAPRQGERNHVYERTDARGIVHRLPADANGIVWPASADEVQEADAAGLPTATDWHAPEWDEPTADEPTADEPDDLARLTVPQLRERAGSLGLEVPGDARKGDLVAAIADETDEELGTEADQED